MKGFYWNSKSLSDLAKYRYYQKLSEITTLTLSPSWRLGNKTCLGPTLTDFREVRISFGIVYRHDGVPMAFFWG